MERYQKLERVGEGTYGVVYKVKDRHTGRICAMKKIRLDTQDEGIPGTSIREMSLLQELAHPNVVGLQHIFHSDNKMHLVFEFLEQDLSQLMHSRQLGLQEIKSYMHNILSGIHSCHSNRVFHRDLKPANLLVDSTNGILKLGDFGMARTFRVPMRSYTHEVVTLWYRPPEILLGSRHYGTAVDIWSIGCIFAEMVIRRPFFKAPKIVEIEQLFHIFRVLGTPSETTWPGVSKLPFFNKITFPSWKPQSLRRLVPGLCDAGLDLLAQLLVYEPSRRITAKDALAHPYFDDLRHSSPEEVVVDVPSLSRDKKADGATVV